MTGGEFKKMSKTHIQSHLDVADLRLIDDFIYKVAGKASDAALN